MGAAVLNTGPVALLLVPAFLGALIGKMADRLPVRNILLVGTSLSMVALIAIGMAPSLLWIAVGFLVFSLGMSMYGPVVVNGMLVKLYPGREARALALGAIGISVAAMVLPPLIGSLLEYLNWRQALQLLAAALLVILWVVIFAGAPRAVVETASSSDVPADTTFYRTRAFWLIGISVALGLNVMIVVSIIFPPFFLGREYSVADAGWFLALSGFAGLMGKTCLAWQGDAVRNAVKWLAADAGHRFGDVVFLCRYLAGHCRAGDAGRGQWRVYPHAFLFKQPVLRLRHYQPGHRRADAAVPAAGLDRRTVGRVCL